MSYNTSLDQLAGVAEYTDCISAENEFPGYDTKQSKGETAVMLEPWGMWSTPLLQSLTGPFWPAVVALDRVQSMGQRELNCELMLNWIVWNRTVFDI